MFSLHFYRLLAVCFYLKPSSNSQDLDVIEGCKCMIWDSNYQKKKKRKHPTDGDNVYLSGQKRKESCCPSAELSITDLESLLEIRPASAKPILCNYTIRHRIKEFAIKSLCSNLVGTKVPN